MISIKKYVFHPFLFNIYVILFVYGLNLSMVKVAMIYRPLLISFLITLFLFFAVRLIFKHNHKTGFFITVFLIGSFSYGYIYDKAEILFYAGNWPFSSIHRYLIISYFIFYAALFWKLYVSHSSYKRVTYFMNVFVLLLIILNFFSIAQRVLLRDENRGFFTAKSLGDSIPKIEKPNNTKLPDVYYIILDGYAREDILKKHYNYNNENFLTSLEKQGFFIADSSYTNYPFTNLSLASSLNLNYIQENGNFKNISFNPNYLIEDNLVMKMFKKMGYRIIHLKSGYAVSENFKVADKTIPIGGPNEFERTLLHFSILRLDDLLGFFTYRRLKTQFNALPKVLEEPSPKFTFIHIVAPHPPFVFSEAGDLQTNKEISATSWESKSGYVQQLQYLNTVIKKFINDIFTLPRKVEPVIILQGDHGPWLKSKDPFSVYKAKSGILNAYFVPESCRKQLYQTITPVNTFRTLLRYFGFPFQQIEDVPINFKQLESDPTFKNYLN